MSQLSRRAFLGASITTVSTTAFASPILDFLSSDSAASEVFSILQTHLQISSADRHLVKPFLRRLRTPGLHTESPATFQSWLNRAPGYEENLAAYILEEFAVASNFLAVQGGHESRLKILPS